MLTMTPGEIYEHHCFFLKPLLFVHGREAYRRNSLLILYNFYKNIAYGAAPFFFGFYSAFSG